MALRQVQCRLSSVWVGGLERVIRAGGRIGALLGIWVDVSGWRALLAWTDEGVRPHTVRLWAQMSECDLRQFFPEKFSAVHDSAAAHVKEIYREHSVFIVIAEYVGVIAFGGGNALALLQLLEDVYKRQS